MRHLPDGRRNGAVGQAGLSQRPDALGERAGDFHRSFRTPSLRGQARRALRPHPPAQQTQIYRRHLETLSDVHPGKAAGLRQLHHHMAAHRDIRGRVLRDRRRADVHNLVVGHVRHVQQRGHDKRDIHAGQRRLCHAPHCNPELFNIQLNNVTRDLPDQTWGQRLGGSLNCG